MIEFKPRTSLSRLVKIGLALSLVCGLAWAAATTVEISQKGKAFSKASLTIKVGEDVRFVNDDGVTHNVFAVGENFSFNLKKQPPGTAVNIKFPREGHYECRCAIHPNMKLEVNVVR